MTMSPCADAAMATYSPGTLAPSCIGQRYAVMTLPEGSVALGTGNSTVLPRTLGDDGASTSVYIEESIRSPTDSKARTTLASADMYGAREQVGLPTLSRTAS